MAIEFRSEAQRRSYHQVAGWLQASLGDEVKVLDDEPFFAWDLDTIVVFVAVHAWDADDALITVRAYFSGDEDCTDPELLYELLRANEVEPFGAFGLDGDNDLFYGRSVLASQCGQEVLNGVVRQVATRAVEWDERHPSLAAADESGASGHA